MKLPMLNPYIILGVVLSHLVLGGLAYWKGGDHMATKLEAEWLSDEALARQAADAVAAGVVAAIGEHKGKTTVINKEAKTIIERETLYKECVIPEDMRQLIQKAGERQ